MRMSSDDVKTFPHFAQYVKTYMLQVASVGVVVQNIKKFGSLTPSAFRHALVWGNDPLIVITDLSHSQCGGPGVFNGCFDPADPSKIQVALTRVQDFETDPWGAGADVNSRGQKVIIVGVTLLHELCHWGNFKKGVTETTEAGKAFEIATYGRDIGNTPAHSMVADEVIITP